MKHFQDLFNRWVHQLETLPKADSSTGLDQKSHMFRTLLHMFIKSKTGLCGYKSTPEFCYRLLKELLYLLRRACVLFKEKLESWSHRHGADVLPALSLHIKQLQAHLAEIQEQVRAQ